VAASEAGTAKRRNDMTTRRNLLIGAGALAAFGLTGARAEEAGTEPAMSPEGLLTEPWFLQSFLDLSDDLSGAHKEGKRFAVMWELRGCPYCRETHLVNFAQPRIRDYIKSNFEVLQLNIIGDRKVTDFDGSEVSEKELAKKYAIRFTPTFQFFPETPAGLNDVAPAKREVARAPGYLRPDDFLAFFRFVREKAYEKGSFRDFLKSQPS
jgi:thioredoxin-related protein